ncbi:MAG: GyrI-like domain-containing protein [Armatimonadota bacterium]
MPKRDFRKMHTTLYQPPREPVMVEVPPMNFVMIDGSGDPNTETWYQAAVEALYAVAYSIKYNVKERSEDLDFVMPPLEALWWVEGMENLSEADRDSWQWTLMIMMPEPVDHEIYQRGHERACEKKCLVAAEMMRFEEYDEGLSAQILHVGPYDQEQPTIERLHAFIAEQGHRRRGRQHEIYLSDPRRTKPENLKTILRQPVE